MDTVTGTVERITFYNEENGYGVVKIKPDRRYPDAQARDGTITIVGGMPELGVGESLQISGEWISDPKYGKQFRVERVTPVQPSTLDGIRNYLASGIVKGIGEATAAKIVDHFGLETLDILNRAPERLHEVKGLKTSLVPALVRAWEDNVAVRQTMIFLQQYNITAKMARRIYDELGVDAIETVRKNPYTLASEVHGIGFIRADQIARKMGMPVDAPERIRAGLVYALDKLAGDGHTYAPRPLLIETALSLLNLEGSADLLTTITGLLERELFTGEQMIQEEIMVDGEAVDAIYLRAYHKAEQTAARLLAGLAAASSTLIKKLDKTDWPAYLKQLSGDNANTLTDQQFQAVQAALTQKVTVLTGGPGTGKTTTLKMVIAALVQERCKFALASPTGRAAKRLQEATGYDAYTIHRLLGYSPAEGFVYNEESPLEVDMLIVDESSMLDLMLFASVLRALKPTTHLMLVGDVDQLPSVGAGNVLRDVIESGVAHVTRLETIFRQGEDSHIVVNAHRINHGELPNMDNRSQDFYFFSADDPVYAADLLVDIVQRRLPEKFACDPLDEVQVIAPMYRGAIGVHALNEALQASLNGESGTMQKRLNGRVLRVGDKVMQTRNNYEKDVFNGDIGRIHSIDDQENMIEVVIDGRFVQYEYSETDELIHAYCISTHRSQGSEYPIVVMPLMTQHYMMLQRNLLYTAITRAKRIVVLVGDRRAVQMAVSNNKVAERFSGLLPRLRVL